MVRPLCALALAAALAGAAAPGLAQTPLPDAAFQTTTLELSAYGEVRAAPDLAVLNIGVVTDAPTAAEALQQNRTQMNATLGQIRREGVADADIQTSGLSLTPKYVYHENQPPVLTGYEATNQVSVRVHDLARLGPLVDATVAAGANRINGVVFTLENPRAAEDEAGRRAVQALQAKAELYAQASGYHVRRLVNLTEGAAETQPIRPYAVPVMVAGSRVGGTTVAAGQLNIRVDVTGVFELTR